MYLQVDEKFQMFFDGESVKKYIMLWTEPQALTDSFHICQYALAINMGRTRRRRKQAG